MQISHLAISDTFHSMLKNATFWHSSFIDPHMGAMPALMIALSEFYLLSWTARLYCASRNTCSVSARVSVTLQGLPIDDCCRAPLEHAGLTFGLHALCTTTLVASPKLEEAPVYNARKCNQACASPCTNEDSTQRPAYSRRYIIAIALSELSGSQGR